MATAPHDSGVELHALGDMPPAVVRQLLETERAAWTERLLWDTRDAVDVAAGAVATHLVDGAALRRGSRWDGFLTVQPGRPVARLCGGWLSPHATAQDASLLVAETLRRLPRSVRVEGQVVAFDSQGLLDAAFAGHGFAVEPREYLVAPLPPKPKRPGRIAEGMRLLPVDSFLVSDCARVLVAAHRAGVESRINASFRSDRGAQEYLTDILSGAGCGVVMPDASLAAVGDGRVLGFCLGTSISPGVGHVPQIAVAPEAQGRGVGTVLITCAFRAMARQGCDRVTLSVSKANAPATAWYAGLGFQPATRFSAYHRDAA